MKVLVVGGTGLVGRELLKSLSERAEMQIVALVRRFPEAQQVVDGVEYRLFNFDRPEAFLALSNEIFDTVFCCLGTTRRKAGSAREFMRVDFEYPKQLIESLKSCSPLFCLVSSVGAERPLGLYLKTKFNLERVLIESGLRYVIVRPSLLLGQRDEFRFGERLSAWLFSPLRHVMRDGLGASVARYAPIEAHEVAHALVNTALNFPLDRRGTILQGRDLFRALTKRGN